MTRAKWLGIVFIGTGVVGMTAWAFHATPEVRVERAQVTSGSITRRVVATGALQAVTMVEVGSQVSGIVQSLEADYNSMVRAGQVVARLDPSLYDAQMRQAQAGLAQAEAAVLGFKTAVEDAQSKLVRAEALAARQLIPQSDLDAARIAMDEANADVRAGQATAVQAQAAVNQAAVNLEHTIIRSPITGIVIDRDVDVGQTLAATIQSPVLFRIAGDLRHMQVQVGVDEADISEVTSGEPASFEVEAYPDETFHGTVTQVRLQPMAEQTATATTIATATASQAPSVVATVVSYTAIIDTANLDERLRPGMTAEVVLLGTRRQGAVRIPNGALAFRPSLEVRQALGETGASPSDGGAHDSHVSSRYVWEYDGQRFIPIAVRTGLADDQWTELLSGSIRPGDALVTSAVLRLRARL